MATKERMLQKLAEKKELQQSTSDPTKFVFTMKEDGVQEKSSINDADLIAMFDKPATTEETPKKSKKSKKTKK